MPPKGYLTQWMNLCHDVSEKKCLIFAREEGKDLSHCSQLAYTHGARCLWDVCHDMYEKKDVNIRDPKGQKMYLIECKWLGSSPCEKKLKKIKKLQFVWLCY